MLANFTLASTDKKIAVRVNDIIYIEESEIEKNQQVIDCVKIYLKNGNDWIKVKEEFQTVYSKVNAHIHM